VADRWGRKRVTIATLVLGAPLMAAGALVPGMLGLAALGAGALLLRLGEPANIAQAQEILTGGRGTAVGIAMGLTWGLSGLTYPAVGALADSFGMSAALAMTSGLVLVAVVPALLMPETLAQQKEGEESAK
ncbi:MAG: hypothetical protein J7M26_00830, partial [Armatimonadetes bacterium]|nr:hypothetical protein [Armatimonadota bacterium]